MKTREYITPEELNALVKGADFERMHETAQSLQFFALAVGRFDRSEDPAPEFPVFREAMAERTTIVRDDGREEVVWLLQTPLILKTEED